jgi:preprotein translocase subunit SecF
MQERKFYGFNIPGGRQNNSNPLMSILIAVLVLVALFILARFIFRILYILSPLFIIAAAIIDHRVIVNYAKWIGKLFKNNLPMGIVASILTVIGFPLVSVYLAGSAYFSKRLKEAKKEHERQTEGEVVDFEELDSEPLELRELDTEEEQKNNNNEYEELF